LNLILIVMKGTRIFITLPASQVDELNKASDETGFSLSYLISNCIRRHPVQTTPRDERHYPLTYAEAQPVIPKLQEIMETGAISPGLQIPKEKVVNDPEITSSFSIKPGPGLATRLQAIGVSLRAVTQARRGKIKGMPYDTSLEKYFDLVGNG
jgi:hypothetical protein